MGDELKCKDGRRTSMSGAVKMALFPLLSRNRDSSKRAMPASVCSLATYSVKAVRRSALAINIDKTPRPGI